jgi:hypothetical protein
MNHVSPDTWGKPLISISTLVVILTAAPLLASAADPPFSVPTVQDEKSKNGGAGKIQGRATKPHVPKLGPPLDLSLKPPSPPAGPIPIPYPNDTAKGSEKVTR